MAERPLSNFLKFIGTPFEHYILPIIPAGAKLSAESHLTAEHLGKIPGKWAHGPREWYGFAKWQQYYTTHFDLEKWQAWQDEDKCDTAIAVAMRLVICVAIDIDENDEARANHIEVLARMVLGAPICVRRREGSARRVLIYPHKPRTMPITKARVAWTVGGGVEVSAVEVLGLGQQVVIEGPHAKGAMHYWQDGRGMANASSMSEAEKKQIGWLTTDDVIHFTIAVTNWVKDSEADGLTLHMSSGKKLRDEPLVTEDIESPTSSLRIKDKERPLLVKAMQAINLDDPKIGYDQFIDLNRALCAATGCDIDFLHDEVWPWVCSQTVARGSGPRTEERGIEWLEEKWRTFKTSSLGADYVYGVARAFGFKDGPKEELYDGDPVELFGGPGAGGEGGASGADPGGAAEVSALSGGGSADGGGAGGGGGPLPPRHTDIAIRNAFIERHGQRFRFIPELGKELGWHTLENGLWRTAYPEFAEAVAELCSEIGDWSRSNGGRSGAMLDAQLKNGNTHGRIERMLAKAPTLVTPLERFDKLDHLLNTPDWVIDLRTMTAIEHDPSSLFRMRTRVSPEWGICGPPKKWLGVLERLAFGRPWLPEALQIWFGYSLTGFTDWQLTLFIPGQAGTGKSLIIKVIQALVGSYGKLKPPGWFVLRRFADERFAHDDMAGLRLILVTETPDNATWNEGRLTQIIDGDDLDVEFKRGGKLPIPSKAKVSISGNHEPRFATGDRVGGLSRRMMRLYVGNEFKLPEAAKEIFLMRELIEEEGPQIMTWLIEGAYKALTLGRGRFLELAQPLLDAAQVASADNDPRQQWFDDRGIEEGDPNKDYILLQSSYHDYLSFRQTEERGYTERRSVFKNAMKEIFGWRWEYVGRGEPDKTKHGAACAYGWKWRGSSMIEE